MPVILFPLLLTIKEAFPLFPWQSRMWSIYQYTNVCQKKVGGLEAWMSIEAKKITIFNGRDARTRPIFYSAFKVNDQIKSEIWEIIFVQIKRKGGCNLYSRERNTSAGKQLDHGQTSS